MSPVARGPARVRPSAENADGLSAPMLDRVLVARRVTARGGRHSTASPCCCPRRRSACGRRRRTRARRPGGVGGRLRRDRSVQRGGPGQVEPCRRCSTGPRCRRRSRWPAGARPGERQGHVRSRLVGHSRRRDGERGQVRHAGPAGDVPQGHRAVLACAGQQVPAGGERQRGNTAGLAGEGGDAGDPGRVGGVPQGYRAVVVAAGQGAPVRGERDRSYPAGTGRQDGDLGGPAGWRATLHKITVLPPAVARTCPSGENAGFVPVTTSPLE